MMNLELLKQLVPSQQESYASQSSGFFPQYCELLLYLLFKFFSGLQHKF